MAIVLRTAEGAHLESKIEPKSTKGCALPRRVTARPSTAERAEHHVAWWRMVPRRQGRDGAALRRARVGQDLGEGRGKWQRCRAGRAGGDLQVLHPGGCRLHATAIGIRSVGIGERSIRIGARLRIGIGAPVTAGSRELGTRRRAMPEARVGTATQRAAGGRHHEQGKQEPGGSNSPLDASEGHGSCCAPPPLLAGSVDGRQSISSGPRRDLYGGGGPG
jgi:hypothetical protein